LDIRSVRDLRAEHLPLLRNADKSKVSKRKNPVSLVWYEKAGILPQALYCGHAMRVRRPPRASVGRQM
jgi:glutamyl/glutaminyl-tRNA synthetase